jgi:hypothetical protein
MIQTPANDAAIERIGCIFKYNEYGFLIHL